MAKFKQSLIVDKKRAERIKESLDWKEGDVQDSHLGEDETFTETAVFGNGLEMDIKCCGTQEGEAWTEAVLFTKEGIGVAVSEPSDDFFGEWELYYKDDIYHVDVTLAV